MTQAHRKDETYVSGPEIVLAGTIIAGLLNVPGILAFFFSRNPNPDVWWHLATGEWIVSHGTLPATDPFSYTATGTPWAAYSWLFELILWGLVQTYGLAGVTLFTAIVWTLSSITLFFLIRRYCSHLLLSGALTLTAICGMEPLGSARPWHFTILCFLLELSVLLSARRPDRQRRLLWLLPLFIFWANVHIQFVLGLVLLAVALLESCLGWLFRDKNFLNESRANSPVWMSVICVLCAAATLINPYGWEIYGTVWTYVGQADLGMLIQEFIPMRFRLPTDWIVLGVALATAFALGRSKRMRLLLPMLMVVAVYFGFRTARDTWLVLLVGTVTLAYACRHARLEIFKLPRRGWCLVFGILVFAMTVEFCLVKDRAFRKQLAETYPVQAVEWIRQQRPAGPMYNPFGWGGYLIYHLPEYPVSMDGRTNVHGSERVKQHVDTTRGNSDWQKDAELSAAGFVLLERETPLARLLACDDQFELAYEDELAVIFVRHRKPNSD